MAQPRRVATPRVLARYSSSRPMALRPCSIVFAPRRIAATAPCLGPTLSWTITGIYSALRKAVATPIANAALCLRLLPTGPKQCSTPSEEALTAMEATGLILMLGLSRTNAAIFLERQLLVGLSEAGTTVAILGAERCSG